MEKKTKKTKKKKKKQASQKSKMPIPTTKQLGSKRLPQNTIEFFMKGLCI
jgi:hypothetical protein